MPGEFMSVVYDTLSRCCLVLSLLFSNYSFYVFIISFMCFAFYCVCSVFLCCFVYCFSSFI